MGMGAIGGAAGIGAMGAGMGAGAMGGMGAAAATGAGAAAGQSSGASANTGAQASEMFNQADRLINQVDSGQANNQFLRLALAMLLMDSMSDQDKKKEMSDLGLAGMMALSGATGGNQVESATQMAQAQNGAASAYSNQAVQGASSIGASLNVMG